MNTIVCFTVNVVIVYTRETGTDGTFTLVFVTFILKNDAQFKQILLSYFSSYNAIMVIPHCESYQSQTSRSTGLSQQQSISQR